MARPTVIAIDWSGARRPRGLWLAVVREGELVESRPLRHREDAVAAVLAAARPVVAGFDFSFSLPAWFAAELGCADVHAVWERAGRDGERWLRPTPPFWRERCTLPRERRFRRCEERLRPAKSVFQLVGPGQIGAGSVRGMPLLAGLRRDGVAIWPFDDAGPRTVVEIYPTALRRLAGAAGPFANDHERDAVCSALVMWANRDALLRLRAARDPVTRIEGDVWVPA